MRHEATDQAVSVGKQEDVVELVVRRGDGDYPSSRRVCCDN